MLQYFSFKNLSTRLSMDNNVPRKIKTKNKYPPVKSGGCLKCQSCQELERLCVAHLCSSTVQPKSRNDIDIKLHDNFQQLLNSAEDGCHLCRCWASALMNGCVTRRALSELFSSDQAVNATSPVTKVSQLQAGSSELQLGHYFKIKSTVEVDMRLGGISSAEFEALEALMDRDYDGQVATAKKWLMECHASHDLCLEQNDHSKPPTRLLDVSGPQAKLVEGESLPKVPYIALSYCWGGDQEMKLTAQNEKLLRKGIDLDSMSRTIQDAITVCRQLEISYLWVDALCIFQGGDNEDWSREASNIHNIYGSAYVTLSVCSAESAADGFIGVQRSGALQIDHRRAKMVEMFAVPSRKTLAQVRMESPLARRGWVFQEELLSPRVLYWSDQGLFWSCSTTTYAENGAAEHDELFPHIAAPSTLDPHEFRRTKDPLFLWDDMVSTFSTRDFTIQSDRLPALSGLASLVHKATAEEYFYGHWRSCLPAQLLWVVRSPIGLQKLRTLKARGDSVNKPSLLPPSWSWANTSPTRKVIMSKQTSSRASFIQCIAKRDMCCLHLAGRTRGLTHGLTELSEYPEDARSSVERLSFPSLRDRSHVWAVDRERNQILVCLSSKRPIVFVLDHDMPEVFEDLLCLEISYIGMLLLQPCHVGSKIFYRRIGGVQSHSEAAFFASAETTCVTLI